MDTQFTDRILTCSDCHAEFIFTAGEQLFFHEKQFKNDPKRCKPCKSRRSGLSAAAAGLGMAAAGLSRTETRTECSECGIETTVPFKPTQGRPVLCRQCFQAKGRALPALAATSLAAAGTEPLTPFSVHVPEVPHAAPELHMTQSQAASALIGLSENAAGQHLSADAAVLAVASMASASTESGIASAADLASIADLETEPTPPRPEPLPAKLMSSSGSGFSLATPARLEAPPAPEA